MIEALRLVLKYLKRNPKRTIIEVVSVILSVSLLVITSNLFVWGFGYMREVEIQINGSWQARYNSVDEEQVKRLEKREEFLSCIPEPVGDSLWQVDVELKKVNNKIFEITQQIGEEIGMTTLEEMGTQDILPNGEKARYDIYYHMELLDFYGITELNGDNSMKQILSGVLVIIMSVSSLLIYSIFALSFLEKKKYIGLLSCVGASVWQRRMFVFGEGILVGLTGILPGVAIGCVGSLGAITFLKNRLDAVYQFQIEFPCTIDWRITVLAGILGGLTTILAVFVPTIQAGKVNALELVFGAGESKSEKETRKYHSNYSPEFNMALRNLCRNKGKSIKMIVFMTLAIVAAFEGYLMIWQMQGKYLLQDDREKKKLDAWVQIYSQDFTLEEELKEKVEAEFWSEGTSYFSVLDMGGVVIDREYIAEDLEHFTLPWWGVQNPMKFWQQAGNEKYYGFPLKLVGIEDELFREYVEANGGIWEEGTEGYPVIMDDYLPVLKEGEEYSGYREVLNIPPGKDVTIQFGTYADYVLLDNEIFRTGDNRMKLHVCCITSQMAPLPVVPGAYGAEADDYTQIYSYYIKCYMPYSSFQKFLLEEEMLRAYGELESYDNPVMDRGSNPVLNYLCIERKSGVSDESIRKDLLNIMGEFEIKPYNSGSTSAYNDDSNLWEYGNVESWNRMEFMKHSGEILRKIFLIGAVLFVLFFTLFSMVNYISTSIYVRKRELSVLKSIGMGYKSLRRMLMYENAFLTLVATGIGAVIAWSEAFSKLRELKGGAVTVELHFPYVAFTIIILVLLALTGGIVFIMVRRVKQINILDALKNENE